MGVLKNELKANFTQIPNKMLLDNNLSFGARILFCYLASKPDNWKIINSDICKTLMVSKETVSKYFNELLKTGWISREREINAKGQFAGGYNYTLYDIPKDIIIGKSPNTEKVLIRKKTENNNNTDIINNTDTTNNNNTLLPTAKEVTNIKPIIDEIYKLFCSIYKKHTGNAYMPKNHEFVNLTRIVKTYSKETIVNKIYLFEAMCKNKVNYFTKSGFADFTIGKLVSRWNEIVVEVENNDTKEVENLFEEAVVL